MGLWKRWTFVEGIILLIIGISIIASGIFSMYQYAIVLASIFGIGPLCLGLKYIFRSFMRRKDVVWIPQESSLVKDPDLTVEHLIIEKKQENNLCPSCSGPVLEGRCSLCGKIQCPTCKAWNGWGIDACTVCGTKLEIN